jgi:nitrile hydratase accessory protein
LSRFEPMPAEEPVFAEPRQAQAFALAVKLSQSGLFTSGEWSEALALELSETSRRGEPDEGSRYYHHWLAALEQLLAAKQLVCSPARLARKEEWAQAYRRIPHGNPVTYVCAAEDGATFHPAPVPAGGEGPGAASARE